MYTADDPGRSLTAAEIAGFDLSNENIAGYFTKADVLRALEGTNILEPPQSPPPGTIRPGIRIYRAIPLSRPTRKRVTAVAVRENGFDDAPFNLSGSVWHSSKYVRPNDNAQIQEPSSRDANGLTFREAFGISRDEGLSAYFSRAMLEPLLNNPSAEGIALYEVNLDTIPESGNDFVDDQSGLVSYLAVATTPVATTDEDGDPIERIDHAAANESNAVLSNKPCPGYCLRFEPPTVATEANTDLNFNGPPYLIRWDKD